MFSSTKKRAAAVKNLELQFAGMLRAELTTEDEKLLSRRKVAAFSNASFEIKKNLKLYV